MALRNSRRSSCGLSRAPVGWTRPARRRAGIRPVRPGGSPRPSRSLKKGFDHGDGLRPAGAWAATGQRCSTVMLARVSNLGPDVAGAPRQPRPSSPRSWPDTVMKPKLRIEAPLALASRSITAHPLAALWPRERRGRGRPRPPPTTARSNSWVDMRSPQKTEPQRQLPEHPCLWTRFVTERIQSETHGRVAASIPPTGFKPAKSAL